MADHELEVELLTVSVFETNRKQLVKVAFTSFNADDPPPQQRETWEIEIPLAIIEAIRELFQQYQYSLADESSVKDLVAENPFAIQVQR